MKLRSIEAKACLPARDFALSQRFYADLGFDVVWSTHEMAYLRHDASAFLLQDYFVPGVAEHFQMHLLVERVDDWWQHAREVADRYGVRTEPPADRPWGLRDFVLLDPSGVMWRIGQLLKPRAGSGT